MKGKRKLAVLVLIAMFVTLFPVAEKAPEEVMAGDYVYSEAFGRIEMAGGSNGEVFEVGLRDDNSIAVLGKYVHNSWATVSYHTVGFWLTKNHTGGRPGYITDPKEIFYVDREKDMWEAPTDKINGEDGYIRETLVIPEDVIINAVKHLYGENHTGEARLYISSVFVLKSRSSNTSPNWNYGSQRMRSAEEIRDAAGWSDETWANFPFYYDLRLTMNMTKHTVTIEADPENGGDPQPRTAEVYVGKRVDLKANPCEGFQFAKWTVKSGGVRVQSDQDGYYFYMPDNDVSLVAEYYGAPPPPTATPVPPTLHYTLNTHYAVGNEEVHVQVHEGRIKEGDTYDGWQWYDPRHYDCAELYALGLAGADWHFVRSSATGSMRVNGMKALSGPITIPNSEVHMYYKVTPTPSPTKPPGKVTVDLYTHYYIGNEHYYTLHNDVVLDKGGTYKGWQWYDPRYYDGIGWRFDHSELYGDVVGDGRMKVYESVITQDSEVNMYYRVTPTPGPTATPRPTAEPTATPVPTATPEPTPIPEPTVSTDYAEMYSRYFTTDAGYTLKRVYDRNISVPQDDHGFGYTADMDTSTATRFENHIGTQLTTYYTVGTDTAGNEWYFIPRNNNATYVHPKKYKGYEIDTASVKYVTELTFPSTISYGGTNYTVTSIGGGTNRYKNERDSTPNIITYEYTPSDGKYILHISSSGAGSPSENETIHTYFGVAGNGAITSKGYSHTYYSNGMHDYYDYRNDYYVYNTTLKSVTIPDTVVEIKPYAFFQCQALEHIYGAQNVQTIEMSAFASAEVIEPRKSVRVGDDYGWTDKFDYYFYNGAYSMGSPNAGMLSWKNSVVLPAYMPLPDWNFLQKIDIEAFRYRKNLKDVSLPNTVTAIYGNAFADCDLNSITIPSPNTGIYSAVGMGSSSPPSESTLGTKGTTIVPKTVIITCPDSPAMEYGIMYADYYDLRAGHPVTYQSNTSPPESYESVAQTNLIKKKMVKTVQVYKRSQTPNITSDSGQYNVFLDEEGGLWMRDVYDKGRPSPCVEGTKFLSLDIFSGSSGGSGSGYSYETYVVAVAIAENGKVYEIQPYGTVVDLGIPAGSIGHQYGHMDLKTNQQYSSDTSSGGSTVLSTTSYLYYLYNGVVYRKPLWESGYGYYSSSGSGGGHSASCNNLASAASTAISPANVERFYVFTESFSEKRKESYSYPGSSGTREGYSYTLPVAYVVLNDGTCLMGRGSLSKAMAEVDYSGADPYFEGGPGTATYSWTPVASGSFKAIYTSSSKEEGSTKVTYYPPSSGYTDMSTHVSTYDNIEVITDSGNLVYIKDIYNTSSGFLSSGTASTILAGQNLVRKVAETESFTVYEDASGGIWARHGNVNKIIKVCDKATVKGVRESTTIPDNYYDLYSYDGANTLHLDSEDGKCYEITASFTTSKRYASQYEYTLYTTWNNLTSKTVPAASESDVPEMIVGYEFVEPLRNVMFNNPDMDFAGWNTKANGSGNLYQPGYLLSVTAPITLYAQWTTPRNIIKYHPNGGVGVMEDDVYDFADVYGTLKKNTFTREGYKFAGWNSDPTCSGLPGVGLVYKDAEEIYIPIGTTTLYAQWDPVPYTIQIASDAIDAEYTLSAPQTITVGQSYTVPGAMADKAYTVTFDKNANPVMSTANTISLSATSASASLTFYGWRLYEKAGEEFRYVAEYKPGDRITSFPSKGDAAFVLFPRWGGTASYITLPTANCVGYNLVGFTKGQAYVPNSFAGEAEYADAIKNDVLITAVTGNYRPTKSETLYAYWQPKNYVVELVATNKEAVAGDIIHTQTEMVASFDEKIPDVIPPETEKFVFLGYYTKLDADGYPTDDAIPYYDETGAGLRVWGIADEPVKTLYAYIVSDVLLDGRGATVQEQTRVRYRPGEPCLPVIPPQKTGYTFMGYYTGIRGTGEQYYDAQGQTSKSWPTTTKIRTLYAYWNQNPVIVPGADAEELPTVLPEENLPLEVVSDSSTVHIYADDYNPSTGALTDRQPYQVSDVIIDGDPVVGGAIPSTEQVAIRAKMGTWMFSGNLKRISGQEYVRMHVTVPYRTQYENPDDETLNISGRQTKTYDFMVPKAWTYWTLEEGGLYFPKTVTVENAALEAGAVTIPVTWNSTGAVAKPEYRLESYGETQNHVAWPSYDADGTPSLTITLTTEEYIISDTPGVAPDVTEHLTNVCHNAAWANGTEFSVKSDHVTVAGVTVLSDDVNATGEGNVPDLTAIGQLKNTIAETAYTQTYESGIPLLTTTANGRYETTTIVTYEAAPENEGTVTEKQIPAVEVNEINVHTPVVCVPHITASHEDMFQCEKVAEDCTVLVLDEEGIHSDFVLQITNFGYHSEKLGYGEQNYVEFLAEEEGKVRNEVCFPFMVWLDVGNDKDNSNDVLIGSGEWYRLGTKTQRFYLPINTTEGIYEIAFRSVAVNGGDAEDKTEEMRNTRRENHVATGAKRVHVTGRLYDFSVVKVGGSLPWDEVDEGVKFTVRKKEESGSEWETLPLRTGVHPKYRNVGGLAMGGYIDFRVKSIGSLFGEGAMCTVVPYLMVVKEDGYEKADVYYEEENGQGRNLRKWNPEEKAYKLELVTKTENAVREWQGNFSLPDNLYIAEQGTDVRYYQKHFGVNFSESFWMKNATVMLRFALIIQNIQGENLYYGMIPDDITNNIWQREAGVSYRYDNQGNRYEIQGGEVAVIYPGDVSEKGYVTNGIY